MEETPETALIGRASEERPFAKPGNR